MQAASAARPDRRSKRLLLLLALLLAALVALGVAGLSLAARSPTFHATAYEPPATATEFALTDHTGGITTLSGLRGTPVLLFFGYTHCPDVCPLTLSRLQRALEDAGAGPDDARVLLVTVDPARDTPEVLARYLERFGANFIGLTGEADEIRELLAAYGAYSEPMHGEEGLLSHSSAVFGIDSEGMIRVLLRADRPPEELRDDVETLLEL